MSNRFVLSLTVILVTTSSAFGAAESKPAPPTQDETGWTSSVEFSGTSDSDGQAYELNSSVGYTLTKHFGMDLGVPFYFVNGPGSGTGSTSDSGVGNPSVDLRWKYPHAVLNYGTVVTGSAPLGDSKHGLSTGRATFDWTNHFDHSFNQVTPFLDAGFSNTTSDSRLFVRPYTTLGLNSHFQEGANIDVWKSVSVGGSLYEILPYGNQTVFSRITGAFGNKAALSHGRTFQNNQQTTGSADIARDNGFCVSVDFSPNSYIDTELGYTRSIHYDLNSVSFSIGFNLGHLLRRSQ